MGEDKRSETGAVRERLRVSRIGGRCGGAVRRGPWGAGVGHGGHRPVIIATQGMLWLRTAAVGRAAAADDA